MLFHVFIFWAGKRKREGHDALRAKSGIQVEKANKAADEQASSSKKHQRKSDFDNDQNVTRPVLADAATSAAARLLQRFSCADTHAPKSWNQSENYSGEHGDGKREEQHVCVDLNRKKFRDAGRLCGDKAFYARIGKGQAR